MKSILNEWALPWEKGAILRHRFWYPSRGNYIRYYLIDSEPCIHPCQGCLTGNLKIKVKNFRKRPGNITYSMCPGLGPSGSFVLDESVMGVDNETHS